MGQIQYMSNLRELADRSGIHMTQEKVAEIIGKTRANVSLYWWGRNVVPFKNLPLDSVERLAQYFQVPWYHVVKRINTNGSHN